MPRNEMTLNFPRRHRSLQGHFPGNPVVPAVAILSELISWAELETGRRVAAIKSARFRSALRPEDNWTVQMEERGDTTLGITCSCDGRVAMSAKFVLEQA